MLSCLLNFIVINIFVPKAGRPRESSAKALARRIASSSPPSTSEALMKLLKLCKYGFY